MCSFVFWTLWDFFLYTPIYNTARAHMVWRLFFITRLSTHADKSVSLPYTHIIITDARDLCRRGRVTRDVYIGNLKPGETRWFIPTSSLSDSRLWDASLLCEYDYYYFGVLQHLGAAGVKDDIIQVTVPYYCFFIFAKYENITAKKM